MSSVISKTERVNQAREELERLYRIFGRVVFLVLPRGAKNLKAKGWQRITFEDTQKPAYQQRLLGALKGKGNLAVRLGPLSDGLRAIDVDRKDRVDEFLRLNPQLRNTVQVYGRKGCQFFFRLPPGTPFPTGDKKAVVKLKCDDGEDFGEWRFGETAGAYSMILGQHPDDAKIFWHIEGDVVKVLAFADIKWPADVRLPWLGDPDDAAQEEGCSPLGYIPPDFEKRIKAYLAKCPPSIAKKGGDTALFVAAGKICNGFDLDEDQTFEALKRWFNPLCKPPWNDDRLRYKASEVQEAEYDKPRGHFLRREPGYPPLEKRPCFYTYHHFWNNGDQLRGPGTYYHTVSKEKDENGDGTLVDSWICAPLEVLAITATREDNEYGWLVEFTSRNGRQKRCAIPARWLAGRGDEALAELLSLGLDIIHGKERALLLAYFANSRPEKRFAAALSTGWHDDHTFVLPDEVLGKTAVWYQGKDEQNPYSRAGTFEGWKTHVAAHAKGNPNLIVALCGAFAGPLFHLFNVPGGGLHWFGHTTMGKTSILEGAQSVWGGPKFRRTWETTAVGLQAVATLHTDTLLVLDEIHMVDPKVLDGAIYALINGAGKSRGNVHAAARPTARWRVLVLSSGEVSSETQLSQSGLTIRAGQTVRILDIPVEGKHGAFDSLHGFKGGAEFADALRESAAQHCGHAGPQFVRLLIDARAAGELDLSARLTKVQEDFKPLNEPQRRVARIFAILALAGELATEWGLLPWVQHQACKACVKIFKRWQKQTLVSASSSPERKILAAVANFIDRFGDDRFTQLSTVGGGEHVRDRAGYWLDEPLEFKDSGPINPKKAFTKAIEPPETRRIFLFTATGLKEATRGHDFKQVLSALDAAGAVTRKDSGRLSASIRTPRGTERLYHVDPEKL